MTPTRAVLPVALLAFLAFLLGAPRVRADDAEPGRADEEDRVVAAYLEGLNIRMRAKAEEARLLEALGEKEKAVAALKEIGERMAEGDAMLARLLARQPGARPSPETGPALPAAPRVNPDAPDRAAVAAACEFLVRAQGKDGLLDPAAARAEGDPAPEPGHGIAVTAAALMAWLDAADFLARDPASEEEERTGDAGWRPFARRVEAAADRAAGALVAAQSKEGRFGGDLDDHLLATWALAAARSRLGRVAWDEPLDRAVALALAAQGEDGWWGAEGDDRDTTALRTAFAFAMLQEAAPLPLSKTRADALETAMWRAQVRALALPADGVARGRLSGVVARSLLLRRALLLGEVRKNTEYRLEPDPTAPLLGGDTPERRLASLEHGFWSRFDPAEGARALPGAVPLAFGTAYAWGGTAAAWRRWRERVLAPALANHSPEGPAAGSWSPVGDVRSERYGRAFSTAFHLLAALHPVVPWHAPRGS